MNEEMTRGNATVTADIYGARAYAWPSGYAIVKDGAGRMAWSVYYAGGDHGATDTLAEALAWANLDAWSVSA